jgi:exoribonuclease-2
LEGYTQVTSSLRRYTDLLAHQQIRAFLRREAGGGGHPLNEEETLLRLAAGDAASQAVTQAERASRMYWTAVYLEGLLKGRRNRDAAPEGAAGTPGAEGLIWEGVVLEKRGNYTALIIPDLALEIQAGIRKNAEPNERLKLRLSKVRIPEAEAVFEQVL